LLALAQVKVTSTGKFVDPSRPVRPLSAYQQFIKSRVSSLTQSAGSRSTSAKERMETIAGEWKAMSEADRKVRGFVLSRSPGLSDAAECPVCACSLFLTRRQRQRQRT
jgi:hypothetical protein